MIDREINLLDMFVDILLHWRVILICMLTGGIIMGGFSYVRSFRSANAQKAQLEELERLHKAQEEQDQAVDADKEWLEGQLTETQIKNVKLVLDYEKIYEDKYAYRDNSILMQIDANKVPKAELTFYITSDNVENSYRIEKLYEDLITGGGLVEYLAKQHDVPSSAVNELITLERGSNGSLEGADSFKVSVIHNESDECSAFVQSIIGYIEIQHDRLGNIVGSHEINVINQSITEVNDLELLNLQKNFLGDIASLKVTFSGLKDAFSAPEQQYYNYLLNGKAMKDPKPEAEKDASDKENGTESGNALNQKTGTKIAAPRISVKQVLIGMILVAFAGIFVIFLRYIFNNKIRYTDDMSQIYHISQLGHIPEENKKKKLFGFIDQWIIKLRGRKKHRAPGGEVVRLAAAAIKLSAGREAANTIYCIGCGMKGKPAEVCQELGAIFEREQLDIKVLDNVIYDHKAMEALNGATVAVLVEKAGATLYSEIAEELELLKRQKINVLGGILVE